MSYARINRGRVYEDSAATLLDQIADNEGAYPSPEEISTITVTSWDTDTGTLIKTSSLVPADTIHSPLRTDNGWTRDATGWNFRAQLDGGHWPEGDRTYRLEVRFAPTDGPPFYSLWELQCIKLYTE